MRLWFFVLGSGCVLGSDATVDAAVNVGSDVSSPSETDAGMVTANPVQYVTTKSSASLKFEEMKEMLELTTEDDTGIIKEYLGQHPSKLIQAPEWGDVLRHFHETGVLKELAVVYGASKLADKSGQKSKYAELFKAASKAVRKFAKRLRQIIGSLGGGSKKTGIMTSLFSSSKPSVVSESLNITRNIEYLIAALWFLNERKHFRDLADPHDTTMKQRIESLELFSLMLDLILEPGFGENVGIQYTGFNACFLSFDAEQSAAGTGTGSKTPQDEKGQIVKFQTPKMELLASFMAYEAVAEQLSMRVRRGQPESKYSKYRSVVDQLRAPFVAKKCYKDIIDKLATFAKDMITDVPKSILELSRLDELTTVASQIPSAPLPSKPAEVPA